MLWFLCSAALVLGWSFVLIRTLCCVPIHLAWATYTKRKIKGKRGQGPKRNFSCVFLVQEFLKV